MSKLTDDGILDLADPHSYFDDMSGPALNYVFTKTELLAFTRALLAKEAESAASAVPAPGQKLTDVQWMNIVNHDRAFESYGKEDAVHLAVKMTEAKLKELNTAASPTPPAKSEPSKDALQKLNEKEYDELEFYRKIAKESKSKDEAK